MSRDAYRDGEEAAESRVEALKRELKGAKDHLLSFRIGSLKGQVGQTYSEEDYPDDPPGRWDRLCAWWRTKREPQMALCPDCGKDSPGQGQDCLYCGWVRPFAKDPVPPPGGSGGVRIPPYKADKPDPPNGVVIQLIGPDNLVVRRLNSAYPSSGLVQVRREQVESDDPNIRLGTYVRILGTIPQSPARLSEGHDRCPHCQADGKNYSEDLGWCRACGYTDPKLSKGLAEKPDVPDPIYTCPSCGETDCWSPALRWCKNCEHEEGSMEPTLEADEDLVDLWTKPPDLRRFMGVPPPPPKTPLFEIVKEGDTDHWKQKEGRFFHNGKQVGLNDKPRRPGQPLQMNRGRKVR